MYFFHAFWALCFVLFIVSPHYIFLRIVYFCTGSLLGFLGGLWVSSCCSQEEEEKEDDNEDETYPPVLTDYNYID